MPFWRTLILIMICNDVYTTKLLLLNCQAPPQSRPVQSRIYIGRNECVHVFLQALRFLHANRNSANSLSHLSSLEADEEGPFEFAFLDSPQPSYNKAFGIFVKCLFKSHTCFL